MRTGLESLDVATEIAHYGAVSRSNHLHDELVAAQAILRALLSGPNRTRFVNRAAHLSRDMELMIARAEEAKISLTRASRMDSDNVVSRYFQDEKLERVRPCLAHLHRVLRIFHFLCPHFPYLHHILELKFRELLMVRVRSVYEVLSLLSLL